MSYSAQGAFRLRDKYVRGELLRPRRGRYAVPGDALAAVEAATVQLDAVASHETAAWLWGLPTLGRWSQWQVTRQRRCQGTARYHGVTVHHARLDPDHVTIHNGVPVTTPARTVLDIARRRQFRAAVVIADAALQARRCTREELRVAAEACRGWPGVAAGRRS